MKANYGKQNVQVFSCAKDKVQMMRMDDMFECGKGVVVSWPECGMTFVPAKGPKSGINYIIDVAHEMGYHDMDSELTKMYKRLM